MKKKLIVTVVITIMCLATFIFGAGFGKPIGGSSVGTVNTTDSNRFVVFVSKAQLDEYVAGHVGGFFNVPDSELANYNDKFFETQALIMFLTDGMSGSIKVECVGYELVGNELHAKVKELSPSIHTMDLRYNTLCVAIPQGLASGISKVVIDSYRVDV